MEEWRGSEKKARQNAIRGSRRHYMRPYLRPFWRMGHAAWQVLRRRGGFTTVIGGGGIPCGTRSYAGNFRKISGMQNFFPELSCHDFFKKISGNI
jgi:hypothetical protein